MTGSIKYKTATSLLDDAARRGKLLTGSKIIESSSGNLGIALAALCSQRDYKFSCVVDPNIPEQSKRMIEAYGGKVICVTKKDANGGYLSTRIDFVRDHVRKSPEVYWTNQYENPANPDAHRRFTAQEIADRFPKLDLLVVGAGTTGTLMGCISYFGDEQRVLAVDSVGSVTFGGAPGSRHIPGLGTSLLPPIFDRSAVQEHVMVPKIEAVLMCRWLARSHGFLLGGSTGTVLAGLKRKSSTLKARVWWSRSHPMGVKNISTRFIDRKSVV